jgi:hypothetical protein
MKSCRDQRALRPKRLPGLHDRALRRLGDVALRFDDGPTVRPLDLAAEVVRREVGVAQLRAKPNAYRFFHAAQIVKHYLGLKADRPSLIRGRPTTLLYLYWEPEDPHAHPFFAEHEAEVREFAEGLRDDVVSFALQSYRDLWNDWKTLACPIVQRHAV